MSFQIVLFWNINSEPQGKSATASTDNELARIDDTFKLSLHEGNWERLLGKSTKKLVSSVVSVCGDTHVGNLKLKVFWFFCFVVLFFFFIFIFIFFIFLYD